MKTADTWFPKAMAAIVTTFELRTASGEAIRAPARMAQTPLTPMTSQTPMTSLTALTALPQ